MAFLTNDNSLPIRATPPALQAKKCNINNFWQYSYQSYSIACVS